MSNAERIILTRKQEYGYNEFEENSYAMPMIEVKVRGVIKTFRPGKEVRYGKRA